MKYPGWLKSLVHFTPIILSATPAAPLAPWVALGIEAAEKVPGATGPQKLEIAKTIAKVGVSAVNAQANATVINPEAADQLLTSSINAVVAATNLKAKEDAGL